MISILDIYSKIQQTLHFIREHYGHKECFFVMFCSYLDLQFRLVGHRT